MKEQKLMKSQDFSQCLQSRYENYRDYHVYPIYNMDSEIIMYEVYSETCTKCIEKWRVIKK